MVDSITVFYIVSILGPLVLHVCLPFLDTSQGNSETGPAPSGLAMTSVRLAAHALTASVFLAIATHDDDVAAKSGASLLATYHFFIAIHGIFFVLLCTTKRFDPYYSFLSYLKHTTLETAILDLVLFVGLIVKNRVAEPVRWLIPLGALLGTLAVVYGLTFWKLVYSDKKRAKAEAAVVELQTVRPTR